MHSFFNYSLIKQSKKIYRFFRTGAYIILTILPLLSGSGFAQSLSINTSGALPDSSAMLDVISANKGVLIPRVSLASTTDTTTIVKPATSLMVYNTNASITGGSGVGYYYYNGSKWMNFVSGTNNSLYTPLIIGGTGTGSGITLQSTTGTGTSSTTGIFIDVGTDGGTVATRIRNDGNFGIGPLNPSIASLDVNKTITGGASLDGVLSRGAIQSDVTTNIAYFQAQLETAAASFNVTDVWHYLASVHAIGAGSSITNEYGYYVHSSVNKGTNNYGFYGLIAASANNWNIYMAGTAQNYFAGNVGVGTTSPTGILHTIASGAKTTTYSGNLLTNTATSSTASIIKAGLEVKSTGSWTGTSASNIGLYVSSVTGGTNNYDAIFNGGGNVGIGTTTPGRQVTVSGSSYPLVSIQSSGGNGGVLELTSNGTNITGKSIAIFNQGGDFRIRPYNTTDPAGITVLQTSGNVGIGTTSPTAILHLKAGTSAANTSPLKLTTGTLLSTIEAGSKEYNNGFYSTNNALNRYGEGGVIFDNYANAGNTSTTETDLYSYTTKANTLAANGEKIEVEYGGVFAGSATATRQVKLDFAGTTIFDTGAITVGSLSSWEIAATLIRVSSTVVRYKISFLLQGSVMAPQLPIIAVGELTGLTLSGTNILKITGTAAGTGAATNDIVAKLGTGKWFAAANN